MSFTRLKHFISSQLYSKVLPSKSKFRHCLEKPINYYTQLTRPSVFYRNTMAAKQQIVECVPNFSEGQDREVIDAIATAIKGTDGVTLLDVDAGHSTNRTVYTFVGSPDAVVEGALNGAKVAYKLIDMSKQKGEHPRIGAMDVCPFVPVQNVEMEECIYCARKFADKLASTLHVPVYLYGYASHQEYRHTVPQIRSGEYESLREKLSEPEWKPDYGPAKFVPQWGATIVGARKFLIAYNVNLISTKEQAHRIALNIRENGRGDGEPGRLKALQALGWWLDDANMAQITINLLNYEQTGLATVFEECSKDARELNLPVIGSQVVGLVPLRAVLLAADYYIKKESLFILDEDQKVNLVINRLGLSSLGHFDPRQRIIEYLLPDYEKKGPLVSLTLDKFVKSVGARTTAPGGGSVAAAIAALGAALGSMVGKLSYGKRQFVENEAAMRELIPIFHNAQADLVNFVDADTNAYSDYVFAMKLPKSTPEEEAVREAAVEVGIRNAISVPLNLAKATYRLYEPTIKLAALINITSVSDLEVGVNCLKLGILAAYCNVHTNLKDTSDEQYKSKIRDDINKIRSDSDAQCEKILNILESRKGRA